MKYFLLALALFATTVSAAPPKLLDDCGTGATSTDPTTISGSAKAGKITLGERPWDGYLGCTLVLSGYNKVPSCAATLESGGDSGDTFEPIPLGTVTTKTTLRISNSGRDVYWYDGYIISYLCVGQ